MNSKLPKYILVASLFLAGIFLFPKPALASLQAKGTWSSPSGYTGTITAQFPPNGGSVEGTFAGSGKYSMTFGGRFWGEFTGGWGGTFSGNFSGWYSVPTWRDVIQEGNTGGPWKGTLNSDGTISAYFTNTEPGGEDGSASLTFSKSSFENSLDLEEDEDEDEESVNAVTGLLTKTWVADVGDAYEAYIIYKGQRTLIEPYKNVLFEPGMIIETKGELSEIIIQLEDGGQLWLGGDGSRVQILSSDMFTQQQRDEMGGGDSLKSPVALQSGHMIVEYDVAGKKGSWFTGMKDGETSDNKSERFVFLTSPVSKGMDLTVFSDAIGTFGGLRVDGKNRIVGLPAEVYVPEEGDTTIWGMFFGNKSKVEYEFDDENMEIGIFVHEGEVVVYQLDPVTLEINEVESAKTGGTIFADFSQDVVIGSFDLQMENEDLENFEILRSTLIQKKRIKGIYTAGVIGIVALVGSVIVRKVIKRGKSKG